LPVGLDSTKPPATGDSTSFSTKPSLAVLPFENLSNAPEQEYYTDGVTDDIITRLAENSELMVITRDSSFFYKDARLDIEAITEKLNVDYILRGSIRRTGEQQVLNVQLINTVNGAHTWAQQYSYTADDLFRVENEIAQGVVTALLNKQPNNLALKPLTMPTTHTHAHEYLLLGRYHFYKFASKEENIKARNLFREAIELDPNYALAYALLGWTHIFAAMNGWTDDRVTTLKQAEQLASKAIDLRPELPLSYYVRGLTYREQGDKFIEALGEVETALKFDPNNANANVLLATLLYYAGRPQVGLERIKEAMKINPHHPYNYHFHLGQAYFVLRQYEEATDAFQQGLASNPAAERLRVWLAATYAQSGDIDNANWEAEQVLSSNPDFSVTRMEKSFHFKDPAELKHFTDGLRLAGFE
ncbi:MAG: tetratricopeptide repeat protein, partial [Gammaproteobacteria bacterium]|nr:tetratricopeptide repeat protein [Gammaproteobacteria bacterium]